MQSNVTHALAMVARKVDAADDHVLALYELARQHTQWRRAEDCELARLEPVWLPGAYEGNLIPVQDRDPHFSEQSPPWLKSATSESERTVRAGLNVLGRRNLRANLSPHFRSLYDAHVANISGVNSGMAMLLSGGVRTWVHTEAVRDWQKSLAHLRKIGIGLHAFAYIDLRDGLRSHVRRASKVKAWLSEVTRSQVEAVLSRMTFLSWELEVHTEGHPLLPNMRAACPDLAADETSWNSYLRGQSNLQFAKVEAATNMMQRAERRRGAQFAVVLRIRPDICFWPSVPLIHFAATYLGEWHAGGRPARPLPLAFSVADGLAVYGRWAAGAFASIWRGDGDCLMPERWAHPGAVVASRLVRDQPPDQAGDFLRMPASRAESFSACIGATGQGLQSIVELLRPQRGDDDKFDPTFDMLPVQNFMLWGGHLPLFFRSLVSRIYMMAHSICVLTGMKPLHDVCDRTGAGIVLMDLRDAWAQSTPDQRTPDVRAPSKKSSRHAANQLRRWTSRVFPSSAPQKDRDYFERLMQTSAGKYPSSTDTACVSFL